MPTHIRSDEGVHSSGWEARATTGRAERLAEVLGPARPRLLLCARADIASGFVFSGLAFANKLACTCTEALGERQAAIVGSDLSGHVATSGGR